MWFAIRPLPAELAMTFDRTGAATFGIARFGVCDPKGGVADPEEDLPRAAEFLELGEHQPDRLLNPARPAS
jgi:hypothetical protein